MAGDLAHEDGSGRDETFLVGERNAGALAHCGKRRLEAGGADDRGHHPIGRPACRFDERVGAGRGLDAGADEAGTKLRIAAFVGDDRKLGPMLHGKLGEARGVAASGQRHHRIGRGIAADEIERVLADRSGGAEHRNTPRARPRRCQTDGLRLNGEHGHTQRLTRSAGRGRDWPDRATRSMPPRLRR